MSEPGADWLVERFEENRQRLRGVAFRMLGSITEADDALQETWLRLSRADAGSVENLAGWLTTVTARVCLDMLRSRSSRREELGAMLPETSAANGEDGNPESEALLADSMGVALLVVLGTLAPAERVAFVLHDMFAVPFDEVAGIVGRSPAAARQLASRARRRVQGADAIPQGNLSKQREIVAAFLAASRDGDFQSLLELLDPDVVLNADRVVVEMGSPPRVSGADAVAGTFSGRAKAARLALVDGIPGAAWARGGELLIVFDFLVAGGKISAIEMIADRQIIAELDVEFVGG